MSTSATQREMILDHLKQGGQVTPLEAIDKFGCLRLGARIFELRRNGWPIEKTIVRGKGHKCWAKYYLDTEDGNRVVDNT